MLGLLPCCCALLTICSARPQQEFFTLSIDFSSDQFQAPTFNQQTTNSQVSSAVTPRPDPNRSAPAPPLNQFSSQTLRPSISPRQQPQAPRSNKRNQATRFKSTDENQDGKVSEDSISFEEALAQNQEFRKQWEEAIANHNKVIEDQQQFIENTQLDNIVSSTERPSTRSPPRLPSLEARTGGRRTSTSDARKQQQPAPGSTTLRGFENQPTLEKSGIKPPEESTVSIIKNQAVDPVEEGEDDDDSIEAHLRLIQRLNQQVEELEELYARSNEERDEEKTEDEDP